MNAPGDLILGLRPNNARARSAAEHPSNRHLLSTVNGKSVLNIGRYRSSSSSYTLATLGRGQDADIFLDFASISRIQCSFEVEQDSGSIMLYDKSHAQSTRVFGDDAVPFRHGSPRQVLIHERINKKIGMGGQHCDLVEFEIHWYQSSDATRLSIEHKMKTWKQQPDPPRCARTIQDDIQTTRATPHMTRIHTPRKERLRYVTEDFLGRGAYGIVHRAVDIDTGDLMAMKVMSFRSANTRKPQEDQDFLRLKREIEILASIVHPHIVDYISHEEGLNGQFSLFMGLKDGSLENLIKDGPVDNDTAQTVFYHTLDALHFLHSRGFIHRDVKPANVLFVRTPATGYTFQLSDFGLCNQAALAQTRCGTPLFTAPEIHYETGPQSPKWDIWSLFVTMLFCLDTNGIRREQLTSYQKAYAAIERAAACDGMTKIRDMASKDPEKRPSAEQLIVRLRGPGPQDNGKPLEQRTTPPVNRNARVAKRPRPATRVEHRNRSYINNNGQWMMRDFL